MAGSPQSPERPRAPSLHKRQSRRRFRPRVWSCVVTTLGCAILIGLGVWQIRRGQQKAAYVTQQKAALAAAPQSLAALTNADLPPLPGAVRVRASGHYIATRQLLMEGRSDGRQLGYDVLTPFVMNNGAIVLVNRGWVPRNSRTQHGPAGAIGVPQTVRKVEGLWRTLPVPGLRLDAHNCRAQPWPRYVSYPTHADLLCLYGDAGHVKVRQGIIQLDPAAADGFVRNWHPADRFPPVRHYGYAAQWFMFCLVALYLFYRLNLRSVAATEGDASEPNT